jgi:hypothetical protein
MADGDEKSALPPDFRQRWIGQSVTLMDSFLARTGRELLAMTGRPEEDAQRLYDAPFVVVSHGTEPDPILNYGNRAALELWEMTAAEFVATPSRLTAEPMLREARERILAETARMGFVSGYDGVRISAKGRRFTIHDTTIWTVTDPSGRALGQAATFARWTF